MRNLNEFTIMSTTGTVATPDKQVFLSHCQLTQLTHKVSLVLQVLQEHILGGRYDLCTECALCMQAFAQAVQEKSCIHLPLDKLSMKYSFWALPCK